MLTLFQDSTLVIGVSIIFGLFVGATLQMYFVWRDVANAATTLPTVDLERPSGARSSQSLTRMTDRLRTSVIGRSKGRTVLRTVPADLIRQAVVEAFTDRAWLSVGSALTGVALIITFGLISYVLFFNVGPAIASSLGTPDAPTAELSTAVSRMGAKFVISASGIFVALLHRIVVWFVTARIHRAATEAATNMSQRFVALDVIRLEHDQTILTELSRVSARVGDGVDRLSADIGRLSSIEVSVKDLGTNVSSALGNMLNNALGEQIERLLIDMKLSAEQIQDGMQRVADAAFEKAVVQITTNLRSINETLKSQSGSQLEQLLEKLQDVVSGSFSSESRNMSTQLAQFGEVIPRMGRQMDDVANRLEGVLAQLATQQQYSTQLLEGMAARTQQQATEFAESMSRSGSAAVSHVLGQASREVESVLGQLAGLQQSSAQFLDGLAHRTHRQAEEFAETVSRSSSAAVSEVLGHASKDVESVLGLLRSALDASATSSDATRRNMAEAGQAMAASLAETRQTAVSLQQQMREIAAGMTATAQSGAAMTRTAQELTEAVGTLQTTVLAMNNVSKVVLQLISDQNQTQEKQHALLDQMQSVWPGLLAQVAESVRGSTDALGKKWGELSQDLERIAGTNVSDLSSSVEDLSAQIRTLHETMTTPQRAAGAR